MMVADEVTEPLPAVMLLRVLERRGAGSAPHLRSTLIAHLRAVHHVLVEWQAPGWLAAAGLFHSFYGSDRLDYALGGEAERPVLQRLLGARAEQMVWLYGACDFALLQATARDGTPVYRDRHTGQVLDLSRSVLLPLSELMVANEVDLASHSPTYRQKKLALLEDIAARWDHLLSPVAQAAVRRLVGAATVAPG